MDDWFGACMFLWAMVVFGPIIVIVALLAFVHMDPSIFNPVTWTIAQRAAAAIWMVIGSVWVVWIFKEM